MSARNSLAVKRARRAERGRRRAAGGVSRSVAYAVCAEANRLSAIQRDRECKCPGRAGVEHAWDLDPAGHLDGCPAGYQWISVDDVISIMAGA